MRVDSLEGLREDPSHPTSELCEGLDGLMKVWSGWRMENEGRQMGGEKGQITNSLWHEFRQSRKREYKPSLRFVACAPIFCSHPKSSDKTVLSGLLHPFSDSYRSH